MIIKISILFGLAMLPTISFADATAVRFSKLVIAHHMNAGLPAQAGGQDALAHGSNTPSYSKEWSSIGGRVRDMSITNLYDFHQSKTTQEQVAWEIKVAQRSGIDAFAFYGAIPHRKAHLLEYMKAAKGTGFKITLCQSGGERGRNYEKASEALKSLVEIDKTMNTFLRVDGKLLLLTYGGNWGETVEEMIAKRKDLEERVGTPMLVMYAPFPITASGHIRNNPTKIAELYKAERNKISALFKGGFDGLSPFVVVPEERTEADCLFWMKLCKEYGKRYYQPISLQFHSSKYMTHAPVGDKIWSRSWDIAKDGADGVQLLTWNDWGETTSMAPGINVNYGLHDMLKHRSQKFKTGRRSTNKDKAWVMYYRYPSTVVPKLYPPTIKEHNSDKIRAFRFPKHDFIWVKTDLTAPAVITCEGRGEQSVAAGPALTSFPLTPGPVKISITRKGKIIKTLSPAEVVSDKPWRVDHSLVLFGSDADERQYREQDFPGEPPRYYGEYGDDDSDGLLNWFEGLYFSVLESPVTPVHAKSNFNGMTCKEAQEKMLNPLESYGSLALKTDINIDLTSPSFVDAIWNQRYHWNQAGFRNTKEGLVITNPKDRNTRESYFFYDTIPNPTYGPNCLYGDMNVCADIKFDFGTKPSNQWGNPEFSLLSRVSSNRASMAYCKVSVTDKHTAHFTIGWSRRERWEPIEGKILAKTTLPMPSDGEFKLSLSAVDIAKDKILVTGVCQFADGSNSKTLTAEHSVKESGIQAKGEIGFSATLHEFEDTSDLPNCIVLKSMQIQNIKRK